MVEVGDMGLFDQLRDTATNSMNNVANGVQKGIERKGNEMMHSVDIRTSFCATRKIGVIELDTANRVMRVRGGIRKRKGAGSKVLRGTAAVMTMGASVLVTRNMSNVSVSDGYLPFDQIAGFEVIRDDALVSDYSELSAGAGAATRVLGVNVAGVLAGSRGRQVTGTEIKSLVIHIVTSNLDAPDLFAVYIDSNTASKSKDNAVYECKQAVNTLEIILQGKA